MFRKLTCLILVVILLVSFCTIFEYSNEESWARNTLNSMTIEEKIGQLFTVGFNGYFFNEENQRIQDGLKFQIERNKVGGFIIYGGNVADIAVNLNYMQSLSEVPLLIASDLETGVGQQVRGATIFPDLMALGAAGSEELAYEMGRITAIEARALGIHQTYSPVVDVNNNPLNPIINVRSIGEDPADVSKLSAAYIKGCQENGLIATAKHFPGHGDTDIDSHSGLPRINVKRERLDKIELMPYRDATGNGLKSIMTAHIVIPEIDEKPATLSHKILTGILRKELDFNGLIVTDALGMDGITNNYTMIEAAVKSLSAGADILLVPPDTELAYDAVLTAFRKGKITESRIDSSVYRILLAKAQSGLHKNKFVNINELKKIIAEEENIRLSGKIAEKSLTLVKNDKNIIPVNPENYGSVLAITVNGNNAQPAGETFIRKLKENFKNLIIKTIDTRTNDIEFNDILKAAGKADLIIIGAFIRVKAKKGSVELENRIIDYLNRIQKLKKPEILVSFSSPYILMQLPETEAYLCTYSDIDYSQIAAVNGILGYKALTGKLPVTIPEHFAIGSGIKLEAIYKDLYSEKVKIKHTLEEDLPENNGFSACLTDSLDIAVKNSIADTVTPGAQLIVGRSGKIVYNKCFGGTVYGTGSDKITAGHVYDLASLTKVIVTTTLSMIFKDKGYFNLDDPVNKYLGQFRGPRKNKVKIVNLLTHSSGLPAWEPLYKEVKSKEDMYEKIHNLSLIYSPGKKSVYSCLGMILLGEILEKISGKSLDELADEYIFKPLVMNNTMYNPKGIKRNFCVPTEVDSKWRGELVCGIVHDENACSMGGVSANAGLFSNTTDLSKFCQMVLNKGVYNYKRIVKEETVDLFIKRYNLIEETSRAIGWDTPSYPSSSGNYFSDFSYGHTGFTGTSIWIDPKRDLFVILLTNRVYPTRENHKIFDFRQKVHDTVVKQMVR